MIDTILIAGVCGAVFGIVGLFLISLLKVLLFWKEDNPHWRKCKRCGQIQNEYGWCYHDPHGWWEDMLPVPDPDCICHYFISRGK